MQQTNIFDISTCQYTSNIHALPQALLEIQTNPATIKQVITWQKNKKRVGCHKTKTISEVSGTGKKPHAQKGSGRARHGTLRSPQMRGGAVVHGPVLRKYGTTPPPKKIRKLSISYLLADKLQNNKLIIMNDVDMNRISTKLCKNLLDTLSIKSALICINPENKKFMLSSRNIPNVKTIDCAHINAYDIIQHNHLIISTSCMEKIQKTMLYKK